MRLDQPIPRPRESQVGIWVGSLMAAVRVAAARFYRRRSNAALVAMSVAGAIVVLGSLFGLGVVTEDLATRRALASLSKTDRLIGLHRFAPDGSNDAADDVLAKRAMAEVGDITEPLVA